MLKSKWDGWLIIDTSFMEMGLGTLCSGVDCCGGRGLSFCSRIRRSILMRLSSHSAEPIPCRWITKVDGYIVIVTGRLDSDWHMYIIPL